MDGSGKTVQETTKRCAVGNASSTLVSVNREADH
jgi:hypothetical protein